MELNITLFVQVVHFIVAYFLLERLFFRPAFFCIQERDCDLKQLQDTLAAQTQQVAVSRERAEKSRLNHQERLVQLIPPLQVARAAAADIEDRVETKQSKACRAFSPMQKQEVIDSCRQRLLGKIL